jgi:2-polyprenyl-6-methoxyphenol hydroxylase-like FAD-dependent oxidoreductase
MTRVATLRQSQLLQMLTSNQQFDIQFGAMVDKITPSIDGVSLALSDGTTHNGHLLVAADGVHSRIRSLQCTDDDDLVVDYGFESFGGIVKAEAGIDMGGAAFETVSKDGHRFAVVPLKTDNEFFWFCHVRQPSPPSKPAYRPQLLSPAAVPTVGTMLQETFAEFHSPVQEIIAQYATVNSSAPQQQIYHEPAVYSRKPMYSCACGSSSVLNIAMVGDSSHATPPNLAQGAAIAIEDAFDLSVALAREASLATAATPCSESSDNGSSGGGSMNTQSGIHSIIHRGIHRGLTEYSSARMQRQLQHNRVTAFTRALTADGGPMAAFRDAMTLVPQPVNGFFFDLFLNYSLGGARGAIGTEQLGQIGERRKS